ncbi:helix-turn-helix transcriptional regulator [Aneurinibacillus thermoaerophilus]|uniref:helix-turn-helix domain-containing protein n=1 Tax=Aneurinibacillus thermoaerophilus TaxID=143495 RepID=UPI002E20E271|nr:helix-turn-helix transcriptional regulator [Aneurinibacillus thermoaerophilus]
MIGSRLRQMRKRKNWTQTELADAIYTTKAAISHYELERSTPSKEMLVLLADVLETSVDFLLGRTDNPSPLQKEPQNIKLLENLAQQNPNIRIHLQNYKTGDIGYVQMLEIALSELATKRTSA